MTNLGEYWHFNVGFLEHSELVLEAKCLDNEFTELNPADNNGEMLEMMHNLSENIEIQTQSHVIGTCDLHQFSELQHTQSNNNDFERENLINEDMCSNARHKMSEVSRYKREKEKIRFERFVKRLENEELALQQKIEKVRRARNILISVKQNEKISVETMHLVIAHIKRKFKLSDKN